jgi:transcriptional regulator
MNAELWAAAAECCTEKQMAVLRLRDKGIGVNRIARLLEISPGAARSRLDAADLRIKHAMAAGETAA